jgi:serine/threonine protein kinase
MATQQVDRATFLTRLRDSGLLGDDALAQAEELAGDTNKPRTLARKLIERGLLTRFQAEMILCGRTDGFILGQYRILDHLGHGGMGRVFKAEHQTMKRIVALKVLAPHLMKTQKARELFQREVRAAARLVHPNIVTAFDANQSGDRHYLVMEFVDGPNLHDFVKDRGPLPVGQVCEFTRQAAVGLQYAHEMGMVHRDIKPANLLVHGNPGQASTVKILDFGLARLYEPITSKPENQDSLPAAEQQVMGTPDYLSPEQARDVHSVDIRSDLYSLGCTMYFLLTGRVPFPGGSPLDKLVRHVSDEAPMVHTVRGDVPLEVSALVARLMAKDPADRFQTPAELAQSLAAFAEQGAGVLPVGGAPVHVSTPVSDSPWANIFDDSDIAPATMPADATVTPIQPSARVNKVIDRRGRKAPLLSRRSIQFVIVAAAAIVGFLLGAGLFAMFMK